MKFTRYITLFGLIFLLSACGNPAQPEDNARTIPAGQFYFSSSTCEHCAAVKRYVTDSGLKNKLFFVEQEVDTDAAAALLLRDIGSRCGIAASELAVPFFWDGRQCYVGQEAVISYFQTIQ